MLGFTMQIVICDCVHKFVEALWDAKTSAFMSNPRLAA
jgi:hypothetical protein